jgi:hypothetical protein
MDFSDYEINEMLEQLVDSGCLAEGSAAHGVALQAFDKGYESLSDRQKAVFDRRVAPHIAHLAGKREVEDRRARWPE